MPRKNKRKERMRPEELRFWQERKENEDAADERALERQERRDQPRKEYK